MGRRVVMSTAPVQMSAEDDSEANRHTMLRPRSWWEAKFASHGALVNHEMLWAMQEKHPGCGAKPYNLWDPTAAIVALKPHILSTWRSTCWPRQTMIPFQRDRCLFLNNVSCALNLLRPGAEQLGREWWSCYHDFHACESSRHECGAKRICHLIPGQAKSS